MKNIPYLLLCLLALLHPNCRKDQDQDCPPDLPCATQTGANTFGCYINGVPWVAKVEPDVWAPTAHAIAATYDETSYLSYNNNFASVSGRYYGNTYSSLSFSFMPLKTEGDVILDSLIYYRFRYRDSSTVYDIYPALNYDIDITKLDTNNRILSGRFRFDAKSNAGEVIKITDGRFDVRYSPE